MQEPLVINDASSEDRVPWGENDVIPSWALDAEAVGYNIHPLMKEVGAILFNYAGPLVLMLQKSFCWTWGLWIATPAFTFPVLLFVNHSRSSLPSPPFWVVLLLLTAVAGLLFLEHRSRAIALVPVARWVASSAPPRVFGMLPLSFPKWLAFNTILSFSSHLDVILNGLFVARTGVAYLSSSFMSDAWELTRQKSIFGSIVPIPFFVYGLIGWVLMGCQGLYCLWAAWPRTGVDKSGDKISYIYGKHHMYATYGNADMAHLDAVPIFLDASRMASLISPWFQACAKELQFSTTARFHSALQNGRQLRRTLVKFFFFSCLESAYFMNWQVSALGLAKAVDPDHPVDSLTMASIIFGFGTGIYTLCMEYQKASSLKKAILETNIEGELRDDEGRRFEGNTDKTDKMINFIRGASFSDDDVWAEFLTHFSENRSTMLGYQASLVVGERVQQNAPWMFRVFQAVVALYLLLVGRAMIQLSGVILCPTGLYNIGAHCVSSDALRAVLKS